MKEITTERLIIRNFKGTDWQDLKEYLSYEEVVRYSPYEIHNDEMAKKEAEKRASEDEILAVVYKESNKVIGELIYEDGEFDSKEIGFFFNPEYQGKGLAKEAASALIDWAYNEIGIRRLTARCDLLNIRSQKLLERLGMRREGILKKHLYFKKDENGNPIWADTCMYAMLKEEWNDKQQDLEKIHDKVAPCALMCYTCSAYEHGVICESSKKLLQYMDGVCEFNEKHCPDEADKTKVFLSELQKYSSGMCSGCRNKEHNICSIQGCFVEQCTKERSIYYCGECTEFPCDKTKEIFEEEVYNQWLEGNKIIKTKGIQEYWKEYKGKSHYRAYK